MITGTFGTGLTVHDQIVTAFPHDDIHEWPGLFSTMLDLRDGSYRITMDPEYDLMEIKVIGTGKSIRSTEIRPNVFVHYDEGGQLCGVTLLEMSKIAPISRLWWTRHACRSKSGN